MNRKKGRVLRSVRIYAQIIFVTLFFFLIYAPNLLNLDYSEQVKVFFYFDPLLLILNTVAARNLIIIFLLAIIPFFLSFLFGRFFCGWICPFGTINQLLSWIFQKIKKPGKIPKALLRIKYYILIFTISAALMGSLIGTWLDPFSFLTRSLATVTPIFNSNIVDTVQNFIVSDDESSDSFMLDYDVKKNRNFLLRQY